MLVFNVRFTPESGRSGNPWLKVRYRPKADARVIGKTQLIFSALQLKRNKREMKKYDEVDHYPVKHIVRLLLFPVAGQFHVTMPDNVVAIMCTLYINGALPVTKRQRKLLIRNHGSNMQIKIVCRNAQSPLGRIGYTATLTKPVSFYIKLNHIII